MGYSRDVSDVFLQSIFKLQWWKKSSCKYYSKQITTRDNGNVQSHEQEETKLTYKWTIWLWKKTSCERFKFQFTA